MTVGVEQNRGKYEYRVGKKKTSNRALPTARAMRQRSVIRRAPSADAACICFSLVVTISSVTPSGNSPCAAVGSSTTSTNSCSGYDLTIAVTSSRVNRPYPLRLVQVEASIPIFTSTMLCGCYSFCRKAIVRIDSNLNFFSGLQRLYLAPGL
jgi:hypothetical protein